MSLYELTCPLLADRRCMKRRFQNDSYNGLACRPADEHICPPPPLIECENFRSERADSCQASTVAVREPLQNTAGNWGYHMWLVLKYVEHSEERSTEDIGGKGTNRKALQPGIEVDGEEVSCHGAWVRKENSSGGLMSIRGGK
jgi:hypothetical protein